MVTLVCVQATVAVVRAREATLSLFPAVVANVAVVSAASALT